MPLNKFGRHAGKHNYDDDSDFDLDDDEYINMRNKRIIHIAPPVNDSDVVNKKYLEEQLLKIMNKLNSHIKKAEENIVKANNIIIDVKADIEAIYKHLNIKVST